MTAADHGQRLDRLLAAAAPEFSRSHLQGLVEAGHVLVDSLPCTHNAHRMRAGQSVRVTLVPTAESLSFRPQPMLLNILHEDDHLLVVDKPAGLLAHASRMAADVDEDLLDQLRHQVGGEVFLVHRLDRATSGLVLAARTREAAGELGKQFMARTVEKTYLLRVAGG